MSNQIKFDDAAHLHSVFQNDGHDPVSGDKVEFDDVLNTSNAGPLLPKVIVQVIKESQEPLIVGANLLDRMPYTAGQTVVFPAIGGLTASDIGEGREYPEVQPNIGGSTVTATIGKSGLAFGFTEEMIRYSNWALMNIWMREAGRALIRHKEWKIFRHLLALGTRVFDNLNPTTTTKGVTHGRDMSGAANGSMIMDDLFSMYAQLLHNGYVPNGILVHPLTWLMWVQDPTMRQFALSAGGGTFFYGWQGQVNKQTPWSNGPQGQLGMATGQNVTPGGNPAGAAATPLTGYNQTMTSAPSMPSYWPFPMTIHVSPFMPFDPDTMLTDIIMFASGELGALIVDEELTTEEWNDPRVDIRKIKLRERYSVGVYSEGQGIAVAKNVKVVPNEIVLPAQTTISQSGSVAQIDPAVAVV